MNFIDLQDYVGFAKDALELLKSTAPLVPNREKRAEIEGKIGEAERALSRSDVKLALELGCKLCDCTFPPNIMLWRESEKAHVCPNLACGRKKWPGMRISKEALEQVSRARPHSWMAG